MEPKYKFPYNPPEDKNAKEHETTKRKLSELNKVLTGLVWQLALRFAILIITQIALLIMSAFNGGLQIITFWPTFIFAADCLLFLCALAIGGVNEKD